MGVAPHKSGIESDNDLEFFGYVLTLYFRVPVTKWCYIYVENHLSTIYSLLEVDTQSRPLLLYPRTVDKAMRRPFAASSPG